MKGRGLIQNKYTLSALILLGLLLADIIIHKGITRVIIPSSFSKRINPVNLPLCGQSLIHKGKFWVKAVNHFEVLNKLPLNTPGIEFDVYFDTSKNKFIVYHDSSAISRLTVDSLLDQYSSRKLSANVWFDFKNLTEDNVRQSLLELLRLKYKYGLSRQIILESSNPALLKNFCDSGFFTSYYVPFFNPYQASENEIIKFADSIHANLSRYPTSALSCYYYQYPVLKRFFPNYPILTWTDNSSMSVVAYIFEKQLANDESIQVILKPLTK